MALLICPDCQNQISSDAAACPHCGRLMTPAVVHPVQPPEVIIQEVVEEKSFPPWAIAVITLLGAGLLVAVLFLVRGDSDDEARNVNIRIADGGTGRNTAVPNNSPLTQTTAAPPQSTTITTLPPQTTTAAPVSVMTPTTTTTGTGESVAVGKSVLSIDAKIRDGSGTEKAVQKETFYLLKKDLDSILRDADIDDEEGQGLVNAFGMSVVFPDKYAETRRKALAEINKNVVAKTLTDAQGKAKFADVKPDSYYLFGITKTKDGFSVWNQPITLNEGATNLNLIPTGSR